MSISLIVRDSENEALNALLNDLGDVLDAHVDFGTEIIKMVGDSIGDEHVDSTLILLFRDYLEFLDGVSVLIRNGCSETAIPVIRTMFEYYLYIMYILQGDTKNRAVAYQVSHIKNKISSFRKTSITGIDAKRFKNILNSNVKYKITVKHRDNSKIINSLLALTNEQPYNDINKAWRSTENRLNTNPNKRVYIKWYSLFNGPINLKELSKKVGVIGEYEILYSPFPV